MFSLSFIFFFFSFPIFVGKKGKKRKEKRRHFGLLLFSFLLLFFFVFVFLLFLLFVSLSLSFVSAKGFGGGDVEEEKGGEEGERKRGEGKGEEGGKDVCIYFCFCKQLKESTQKVTHTKGVSLFVLFLFLFSLDFAPCSIYLKGGQRQGKKKKERKERKGPWDAFTEPTLFIGFVFFSEVEDKYFFRMSFILPIFCFGVKRCLVIYFLFLFLSFFIPNQEKAKGKGEERGCNNKA